MVIASIFALIFFVGGIYILSTSARFLTFGEELKGTIIDSRETTGKGDHFVLYTFQMPSGEIAEQEMSCEEVSRSPMHRKGDVVNVLYLRRSNKVAQKADVMLGALLGIIFIAAAIYLVRSNA